MSKMYYSIYILFLILANLSLISSRLYGKEVSTETIVEGLKEGLKVATKNTIDLTSKKGGFNLNPEIHIPLPEKMKKVEKALKGIGMERYVEKFENKMNESAEKAASLAMDVFVDSIKKMTFKDAKEILFGKEDAATEYFKKTSTEKLIEKFKPIIQNTMNEVGVFVAYNALMDKYKDLPMAEKLDFDLVGYINDKAIEGLFKIMAKEEAKIRKDPSKRTNELLQSVFGLLD